MRLLGFILLSLTATFIGLISDRALAQTQVDPEAKPEGTVTPEGSQKPNKPSLDFTKGDPDSIKPEPDFIKAEIVFKEQSWFTDVVSTAVVKLPESIDEPDESFSDEDISFLSVEVLPSESRDSSGTEIAVRFSPRRPGLSMFPSMEFRSETQVYRTPATQLLVGVPERSSEMQFQFEPAKATIYVGEPLRVDVTWSSQLPANQIRSLQCHPAIFRSEDVEVLIPRCTAPTEQQMGMPFGGRRIIAKRVPTTGTPQQLGTVKFPIFLRFEKPGTVEIASARLECAVLKQNGSALAPYAAYYNNGLFEPFSSLTAYDRVFAETEPITIVVRPLPAEGRSELFSGLFAPCEVDVSISTNELNVGQVLDVDLRIISDAPHGMLDLQPLNLQRSLRGRFQVSKELGRTWFSDGTALRARVRPLTTKISAFPSLQIPVFDPKRGVYQILQTSPIPVQVHAQDGRDFFDFRSLVAEPTLTDQPEGIWHNLQPTSMSQWMNNVITVLAEHMVLWMLLGTALFVMLVPWVRERRRRATSPRYRQQALAYRKLRRQPEGSPEKWLAFREFLASGFSMSAGAWTSGDAATRLREIGLPDSDIELISTLHESADASEFSANKPRPPNANLDGLALNELARRLLAAFRKNTLVLLFGLVLTPSIVIAGDWENGNWHTREWKDGETLFNRAMDSPSGLPETEALFTQAALKFEVSAVAKNRPGASWYNAGNAWFQAGELGRAIACYRQAEIYLPFHVELRENLTTARALTVDVVEPQRRIQLHSWPVRWICAALVPVWLLLVFLLLVHLRWRTMFTRVISIACCFVVLALASIGIYARSYSGSEGVVVVGEIYGRKGPAYSYSTAFNEPLHDGAEFCVKTERSNWLQIELADGRQCWIPSEQTQRIENRRY